MNLMAVIMLISLNGVHVKLLGMRRVYMATWRSCNNFDLLHINKGCPFEPGTRSNQWADESNTERAVTNFVTQTTRVFLLTQLITRQYTNFHISSIHLEIQGARMVT